MQYPVAIEWGDADTATGIVIPDIPDSHTAGDSLEEAYELAIEIAHLRLEELAARGEEVPQPSRIDTLRSQPEYAGRGWGIVDIDVTPYLGKTEKVNVTLPGIVIRRIDAYVSLHGIKSRSAFLANAAIEKLGLK